MNRALIKSVAAVTVIAALGLFVLPTNAAKETLSTISVKIKYFAKNGKFPAKHVTYSNSKSGLKATNVQGALDEIGTTLSEALTKGRATASASSVRATSFTATTWKGKEVTVGDSTDLAKLSDEITVTFTPSTNTTGTYTSSSLLAFNPNGSQLVSDATAAQFSNCDVDHPTGTFSGKYEIISDSFLYITVDSSTATSTKCRFTRLPLSGQLDIRGNTITYRGHSPSRGDIVILTRQ